MKKNHLVSVCVIGAWLITIVLLCIAGKKAFFDLEENDCEMTYMFEYPEYIRIKLKKKISKKYPRYGLYLYGEGLYAQEQRRFFSPNGIPVLFIPGNAGSYRQVRSLASVALRKAERHRNHFNYFTIDFDEDFSGLYGGVLMEQVNFVHSCLRHIIRMYERKTSGPVILIGHSMGGMIARALFTLDNFQSKFVSIIITLGTPHVAPVVPFDSHLNTFYATVNNFWENNPSVANLSVISLAGGTRDILVPARYCFLPRNVHIGLQYSAVTTAVPDVWVTIDHLALCWCKQLVLVINRALFALIDEDIDTNRITKDRIKQVRVLRHYFGAFDKQNEEISERKITQSPTIYNETSLWNNFEEISLSGTLLIPADTSGNDVQFIALSNSLGDISIMSCQRTEIDRCTGSKVISFQAIPKTSKEKAGFVHHTKLTNTSYIKVSTLKGKPQLAMQFLRRYDTNKQFDKFRIFSGVQRFLSSRYLFTNISLPMIRNSFDVYLITVEKVNCENDRDGLFTGRIHLPWSREDVYARPMPSTEFAILLKIHTSKPTTASEFAQLHVWKTDGCSLEVTVEYQFAQTLGRIFILCAPLIPQWIYSWIMIVLVIQIRQISDKGICSSVWSIVTSSTLPKFIPLFMLLCNELLMKSLIGSLGWFDVNSQSCGVDGLMLCDWALPSCFIILTAFVIFLALYLSIEIILSSLAWLLLLSLSKHIQPKTQTSTSFIVLWYSGLGLVVFSLMCLCSSIAIYFLAMASFIHCCKTTAKSGLFISENSSDKFEVTSKLNLSKLLLVFFLVASFQTTPAFIVWLKVLPTSWFLPSDPFRTLVLLLFPSLVCCLEMHVHKPPRYAAYIILFMWCVGCLLRSLDRFPYMFGFILLAVDFFVFGKHNKHKKN